MNRAGGPARGAARSSPTRRTRCFRPRRVRLRRECARVPRCSRSAKCSHRALKGGDAQPHGENDCNVDLRRVRDVGLQLNHSNCRPNASTGRHVSKRTSSRKKNRFRINHHDADWPRGIAIRLSVRRCKADVWPPMSARGQACSASVPRRHECALQKFPPPARQVAWRKELALRPTRPVNRLQTPLATRRWPLGRNVRRYLRVCTRGVSRLDCLERSPWNRTRAS